jgi:hypothetical protein
MHCTLKAVNNRVDTEMTINGLKGFLAELFKDSGLILVKKGIHYLIGIAQKSIQAVNPITVFTVHDPQTQRESGAVVMGGYFTAVQIIFLIKFHDLFLFFG